MSNIPSSFIKTAKICGIEHSLKYKGHFYVEKHKVLSKFSPKGVIMESKETPQGIQARVIIKKGVKIEEPLFFCFGLLRADDEQNIYPNIIVEDGAYVKIISHCSFPEAKKASHQMEAKFDVGRNAEFVYEEHHYHGESSGAVVVPALKVFINEGGIFESSFSLSKGSVGKVNIELEAYLSKNARTIIETKVLGKTKNDDISILDKVVLSGEGAKSLIKMRAAAKDGGKVIMQGETYANAPGAVGHVDCQEILVGKGSVARAIPIVEVDNDQARVTHEASVGKINQKELETLMTRGLDEDEATELIINAMMR